MARRDRDRGPQPPAPASAPTLPPAAPLAGSDAEVLALDTAPDLARTAALSPDALSTEPSRVDAPAPPPNEPALPSWPAPCRVLGPGSVVLGGRFHGPGAVVVLSAADARDFGPLVERV